MSPFVSILAPVVAPVAARHQDAVLSVRFRKALGRKRQNPPKSFFDKLFWMSVNTDTSSWTRCADKVEVRKYVSSRCGEEILPKLYAIYGSAEEVDFSELPDSFAIKTNNGCASNYLVRSREGVDLEAIRKGLKKWLRFPYGELTGQLHYARIRPLILAEELLRQDVNSEDSLIDYKFYCFAGVPMFCFVNSDRSADDPHSYTRMMYDMEWKMVPNACIKTAKQKEMSQPVSFSRMIEIAAVLSDGFPFVRVDLYEVNGAVKFGELTFTPGMGSGFTDSFQRTLGDLIVLPEAIGQ